MLAVSTVVVSWVRHHGRSEGLADALGASTLYMPWARAGQPLVRSMWGWLRSGVATARSLRALPPSTVIVTAPPAFAPLCALAFGRRHAVVIDLHSGALNDYRWRWTFPLMRVLLRRANLVVVTNMEIVAGVGLGDDQVAIVHDLLQFDRDASGDTGTSPDLPLVVFPASGAPDEPIDVVVQVADLVRDEVDLVVTGITATRLPSVRQVGFLPIDDYRALLCRAAAVLTLTTREATMQQAAYEALHAGVPIVCSDTRVLRATLRDAAVPVDHTPESIAGGIRAALSRRAELVAAGAAIEADLRAESERGLRAIRALDQQPRLRR